MGEVYKARDTKLNRQVAIKVQRDLFANDASRLARFQREAQVLASLNHPNIAQIYGLEESNGATCIVMELVEGETLAQRLERGPIPLEEVLDVAKQICEGLEAAHDRGIVHRDLKPGNVIVTAEGGVKVLDFGLAKGLAEAAEASLQSNSPTVIEGSLPGTVLGTAAYMSPEQTRGKPVDRRTDVWAFGCVLFELLTGRKAFPGETALDSISAIHISEPNWSGLPSSTPLNIRRLLRRCLTKDPRERLQHIGDARIDISHPDAEPPSALSTPRTHIGWRVMPWALAVMGVAIAALILVQQRKPMAYGTRPSLKFSIDLPAEAPLAPSGSFLLAEGRPSLALTRDGRYLAYVAMVGSQRQLYLRDMRSGDIGPIRGTEDAQDPFFSPDGEWIGFFAENRLKKIRVAGGTAEIIADAPGGHGAVWGADQIYFASAYGRPITRISPAGGPIQAVTTLGSDNLQSLPYLLPDATTLLFTADNSVITSIAAVRLGTEAPARTLVDFGADAKYVQPGHLLYAVEGRLVAAPFDPRNLQTGTPTVIVDDVRTDARGSAQATWSDDGTLVYAQGTDLAKSRLVWLNRSGQREPLPLAPAHFSQFDLSPDGNQVALSIRDRATRDIWIYEIGRAPQRLTFSGTASYPLWSRDGTSVFFLMQTTTGSGVYQIKLGDADRTPRAIIDLPARVNAIEDTTKGLIVATRGDLMMLPWDPTTNAPTNERKLHPVLNEKYTESLSRFSPDARWLAYTSDETGRVEVYVTSYPDRQVKRRVSTDGGEEPRWRPDGHEIIYRFGSQWFSAAFSDKPALTLGASRLLFEGSYVNVPGYSWAMTPDGSRYLLLENPELLQPVTRLTVLTNLFDEIQRRVRPSPQAVP